jgi:hypothetical protein
LPCLNPLPLERSDTTNLENNDVEIHAMEFLMSSEPPSKSRMSASAAVA